MCHDDDSRAPAPPRSGPVASRTGLTLTSADGTQLRAYEALPEGPAGAGIVLLPDVRGLHPFYEDLAVRFAEAGLPAVAVDYFGRTAGTGARGDDFVYRPHVDATEPAQIAADAAAAVARLRESGVERVYTVGFCFGGSQSWRLGASDIGLSGVVGFYGKPTLVREVLPELHLPMLLLVAGADAATPLEDFETFDRELAEAGVPHEMTVYAGAPHSFFDRSFADWKDAGTDAWHRILAFTA